MLRCTLILSTTTDAVGFSTMSLRVREDEGLAQITLFCHNCNNDLTVTFSTISGNATEGEVSPFILKVQHFK